MEFWNGILNWEHFWLRGINPLILINVFCYITDLPLVFGISQGIYVYNPPSLNWRECIKEDNMGLMHQDKLRGPTSQLAYMLDSPYNWSNQLCYVVLFIPVVQIKWPYMDNYVPTVLVIYLHDGGSIFHGLVGLQQARKPRSYASSKLCRVTHSLTYWQG